MPNDTKIQSCKSCPAGNFAQKIKEYTLFEAWPKELMKFCNTATVAGNSLLCDTVQGWFVNNNMLLDSSGERGIPQGLKYQMKTFFEVDDPQGGSVLITYRLTGFNDSEYFRFMIDGDSLIDVNEDTQYEDDIDDDGFVTFESPLIERGVSQLEISLLSEFETHDPNYVSKARVEISKIAFIGNAYGGAVDCIGVEDGFYAEQESTAASQCEPGHEPSEAKDKCILCEYGTINPEKGGTCNHCPRYTMSDETRTQCILYDTIINEKGIKHFLYQTSPKQFCKSHKYLNLCQEDQDLIGPIKLTD